ncbi:Card1-like endonuclease domain-containing protein [uncultured Chloroflexus sp.]|uniref:Card1-like endonuclease domain-containing protein n=1 Tax=uncultured Chloroflexus sp. TaxID=214040 RepID=UPI0026337B1C|nr:DUF1887 family CARF protein [uncultured Chloroflexus sp.]
MTPVTQQWLPAIQQAGFIDQIQQSHHLYNLHQVDQNFWKFVDGQWLELFGYDAAKQAGCFDDVCYNLAIPIPNQNATNQIDLAATYAASLLIAECKAEEEPFKTAHLDKLSAIANMIGGSFVVKLFITARSRRKTDPRHMNSFLDQAKARQIVVVTGEQLPDLATILKQETQQPTYARV